MSKITLTPVCYRCRRYKTNNRLLHSSVENKMKFLLCTFSIILLAVQAADIQNESDCKCWEGFKPEKDTGGYYCRGEKNHRIFSCGEEKPPICKCLVNGKSTSLDLGETNCLSVDLQHGRWCQNRQDFEEYFRKHPEKAIYD